MAWPLSQDYNEAVQSPTANFADADLRTGEVVTNALGLPLPCSGNFADVYQVRCRDGSRWAVKCFTRESPGLRERYLEISRYLRQAKLPFTVDFSYLEQGIRVAGRWYPVLKMEWIEGLTLNQFVAQYVDKPAMLEALLHIWQRLEKYLRDAKMAHCDLQHGNVLLVPGANAHSLALKLIDYDGMYVPALAGSKSGEVGHASYQHPQRLREGTYNRDVDRFPLLLIATALRAVTVKGRTLWEKYDNGDNLLFKEVDLQTPTKSMLFLDLLKSDDKLTVTLTNHLLDALRGALASAPRLEKVLPEPPPVPGLVRATRPTPVPSPVAIRTGATASVAPMATLVQSKRNPLDFTEGAPAVRSKSQSRSTSTKAAGVLIVVWIVALAMLLVVLGGAGGIGFLIMHASSNAAAVDQNPPITDTARNGKPTGQPQPPPVDLNKTPPQPNSDGEKKPKDDPALERPIEQRLTNTLGMKLVLIFPGRFRMGSPVNEVGRNLNEGPQHEVKITKAFYLSTCKVTRGQFATFVKDENYQTEAERAGDKLTWRNPGYGQTDEHPVVVVTWHDAMRFCQWLSKKEKRTYTLPTEAEWEYACRAGTTTTFFFGDDPKVFGDYAWYAANAEKHTHPVGGKKPNPWGLYDMCGNIREWCRDGLRVYTTDAVVDPVGPEMADSERVFRGGDFNYAAAGCRSAVRMARPPGQRTNHSGFRVVCER